MRYLTTILILLYSHLTFGQTVDFDKMKFNGLNFYSTKSEIINKLGNPKRVYYPNYECGFLSGDGQGIVYYTLDYGKIKFTGNERDKYFLEKVDFENNNSLVLNYKQYKLSCKTTLNELIKIFGSGIIKLLKENRHGKFTLMHEKCDDGIVIEIKKGKLVKIEYWSPC
jgi:hypothetical protein